jgi:hypothetical protein
VAARSHLDSALPADVGREVLAGEGGAGGGEVGGGTFEDDLAAGREAREPTARSPRLWICVSSEV